MNHRLSGGMRCANDGMQRTRKSAILEDLEEPHGRGRVLVLFRADPQNP